MDEQTAAEATARRQATTGALSSATAAGGALAHAQTLASQLQLRQRARQQAARGHARADSRRALLLVVIAGGLALLGALALVTALVSSMRRPLDALVEATRDLAAGELDRRVDPAGPRELQDLGAAFNAMGAELASAQQRIEGERHRLAVTVESLGDALIVTEPGGTTIATINPRAAELVPELIVGATPTRRTARCRRYGRRCVGRRRSSIAVGRWR